MQEQEKMIISAQKQSVHPPATLLRPSMDWMIVTLVRAIFFTQSINSNANLIQKHSPRHIQKYVLPAIWHPLL